MADDGLRMLAQFRDPARGLLLLSEDAGRTWAFTAPDIAVNTLADLHFATADVAFAADGVDLAPHRSDDGGWSWAPVTSPDGQPVLSVLPSPNYQEIPTVFAGTTAGIHRSDDGGESWRLLAVPLTGSVNRIAVAPEFPDDPTVALIVDNAAVFLSGGESDTFACVVGCEDAAEPSTLALSPAWADDGRAWVGTRTGSILVTHDWGVQWQEVWPEVVGPVAETIQDVVALSSDVVLAVTASYAVLRSDDGGSNWGLCDQGIPEQTTQLSSSWGHYRRLARPVHGTSPILLASWQGVVTSEDGVTWQESCTLLPTYVRGMGVSAGYPSDPTIWLGSYGSGLYRSCDGGATWSVQGDDLARLFVIDFAASPGFPEDPTLLMSATRRIHHSDDGGLTWQVRDSSCVHGVKRIVLSPAFVDDRRAYAVGTAETPAESSAARSPDGGATWECVWSSESGDAPQLRDIAFSAVDPDIVYGVQSSPAAVLRSTSSSDSWESLASFPPETELAALFALDLDGDDVLLAVSTEGLTWRGVDGEWSEGANVGTEVLRGRSFVPPGSFAAQALYLSTVPPGILRSFDGGASWEELASDFGSPILELAFPPTHETDPIILASTHYGVFFRCGEGEPWRLLDRVVRLEEDACPLLYSGDGWARREDGGTGQSYRSSSQPGDLMEATVQGSEIRWLVAGTGEAGRAALFVDGESAGEIDLATVFAPDRVAFTYEFEAEGEHSLAIEVIGDGAVTVDAIEVVRRAVTNGPAELYEVADWCEDLDGAKVPTISGDGGCCGGEGDSAVGTTTSGLVLVLSTSLLVRRRERTRGARPPGVRGRRPRLSTAGRGPCGTCAGISCRGRRCISCR